MQGEGGGLRSFREVVYPLKETRDHIKVHLCLIEVLNITTRYSLDVFESCISDRHRGIS